MKFTDRVREMTDKEIRENLMFIAMFLDEGEPPDYFTWDTIFSKQKGGD